MITKLNCSNTETKNSETNNSDATAPLWLALHFDQLPVEVFARGEQQKAVVVTTRQRIVAMNQVASDLGIQYGSSMDTAYSIAEQISSFEKNETREIAALAQLAQTSYQFSPNVAIKAPCSLLLDITGCTKLWGGLEPLLTGIQAQFESLGYSPWLGLSCTPMSALLLAKWAMRRRLPDKVMALQNAVSMPELASGHLAHVFRTDLSGVDIDCLEAGPDVTDGLAQMGIAKLEQLLDLPDSGIRRRFGIFFCDYLERLLGRQPDPQKYIGETPTFFSDINFLGDVTNIQSLAFPAKRLLTELCDFLHARQLQINRFTFRLAHRSHAAVSFSVYLANPDNDLAMFQMLTQLKLEQVDNMPEVDNISLSSAVFYPADRLSGDLFEGTRYRQKDGRVHSKADLDNANRLINMLRARLGPNTCFGISEANDHRPEKAWKPVRMSDRKYWQAPHSATKQQRPFYLLPEPRALNLVNNQPVMNGEMQIIRGPERIDFGWWDNNTSARDYYVCRQAGGALYWVFKHTQSGRWFLHGVFS